MLTIQLNDGMTKRFDSAMRNAPRLLQPALLDGMKRVGLEIERHIKSGPLSGQALKARTGTLRRAVFSRAETVGEGDAFAVIGADLTKAPYGRAQEFGGTIRPKNAMNMAIPVGAARTAAGVGKFSARDLISNPRAYGYTGAFFRRHVLFGTKGKDQAVPLFVLKPVVTLKPTGYIAHSVEEKRAWAVDELGRAVARGLKKIFPGG